MRTKVFGRLLMGTVALTLTGALLCAQDYRGRIQGTVFEPSKSVIAGAAVRLTKTDSTISSTRQSAANGLFLFDLMVPGTCMRTVEPSGFSKFEATRIVIRQRAGVTVDAVLNVGAVSDSMTVAGSVGQEATICDLQSLVEPDVRISRIRLS